MKEKFQKFVLLIASLSCLFLLASIPNFSTKANDKNYWYMTEDEIVVDKTVHDFGTIKESDGKVSATFTITNNTKNPFLINFASASCGCTVPEWTKEPIEPGKTGTVIATYNPLARPGPFNKTITIVTSNNTQRLSVRIIGIVE